MRPKLYMSTVESPSFAFFLICRRPSGDHEPFSCLQAYAEQQLMKKAREVMQTRSSIDVADTESRERLPA